MIRSSKFALWLIATNLVLSGWFLSRDAMIIRLKEKGFDVESLLRKDFQLASAFWEGMYLAASIICMIYMLHGKQSRNPKHIPTFELVVSAIVFCSRIWDMIPG